MSNTNSDEKHSNDTLNKLRAAVLGANDGIVSTAAVIMGVAAATNDIGPIFTAGLAALVAGAISMAVGEYVSVSSQSDAEKSYLDRQKGNEASEGNRQDIVNPWSAAIASFLAFAVGGLIPFIAVLVAPEEIRIMLTGVAVVAALFLTGYISATVGQASRKRAVLRVVIGGLLAMIITYLVGSMFGTSIS